VESLLQEEKVTELLTETVLPAWQDAPVQPSVVLPAQQPGVCTEVLGLRDGPSHRADQTVGASFPQAGGGLDHAGAAAPGSEEALRERQKEILAAHLYRHLIKETYLKIAPAEWHQGGESMLGLWKGQERKLYLELCKRLHAQPLSHEEVMKTTGVSSAGRASARARQLSHHS